MMDYIKMKAPATAANLGAGFDVFGMALEVPYDKMFEFGFSLDELVWLAAKGEIVSAGVEHADNVAAALFGGFTVVHGNRVIALSPVDIGIVAILPDLVVNTRDARGILPKSISLEDFVFDIGSASMMAVGILRNDIELIGESMQNHVIESARAGLIPGYLDIRNSALQAGATGVAISGSGPAVIAVCALDKREEVASAMVDAFAKNGIDSEVYITTVGRGVEILE